MKHSILIICLFSLSCETLLKNDIKEDIPEIKSKYDFHLAGVTKYGNLSHIEVLLKDKDPDSTDENEYTLLMIACKEGHLNVVKYLISKGANVNARAGREFETTPLILSIVNKHKENYKYLLQNKADSNLPRRFFLTNKQIIEVTPLEEAINVKDEDAVRELLQAGASPKDLLTLSEKSGNKNIHKMIKKAGGTSKNE